MLGYMLAALQVLLEPLSNMPQAFQARMRVAAARQAVALALEAHEEYFATHVFEGGEELFGLLDIAARVAFAVDDEQGRMNVSHVGDGRHVAVPFGFFVGRAFQVIDGEFPADVAAAEEG